MNQIKKRSRILYFAIATLLAVSTNAESKQPTFFQKYKKYIIATAVFIIAATTGTGVYLCKKNQKQEIESKPETPPAPPASQPEPTFTDKCKDAISNESKEFAKVLSSFPAGYSQEKIKAVNEFFKPVTEFFKAQKDTLQKKYNELPVKEYSIKALAATVDAFSSVEQWIKAKLTGVNSTHSSPPQTQVIAPASTPTNEPTITKSNDYAMFEESVRKREDAKLSTLDPRTHIYNKTKQEIHIARINRANKYRELGLID